MKTLALILLLNMPPVTGFTDTCLARLFEALRQIDVRVRSGQYDEPQRLNATRRALQAFIECRERTATSPRPD